MQSSYTDVKCTVRINSDNTPWFDVLSGVKQGCILSPTLFSIYINDLASKINDLNCGIQTDETMLSILLYADDIVLLAPDEISLQRMMNIVSEWCDDWKLTINDEKTKVVHFSPQSREISRCKFTCGGQSIQFTDSYRYLGVWLDEHITFHHSIRMRRNLQNQPVELLEQCIEK